MRLRTKIVVSVLAVVVGLPGAFVGKQVFFPHRYDVVSIATLPGYQEPDLMERAWSLPAAAPLKSQLFFQSNPSTCGPSSLANVERSFGVSGVTSDMILEGSGRCWTGVCLGGLSLDQLEELAKKKTKRRVSVLRDLSLADFREHLRQSNQADRRYVANFNRGLLFVEGHGHFSPIGGYLEDRDLVLVLDTNEHFKPWLVPSERLFAAMDSIDGSTGKKRGLLLLQ